MERVALEWNGPYNLNVRGWGQNSMFSESQGLYMFLDSRWDSYKKVWVDQRLLYVGQVYDQNFLDRIQQHLNGEVGKWINRNVRSILTVKLARVEVLDRQRISAALVDDIESLLIITQQPPANVQSTVTYSGRELTVFNQGRPIPLPEEVSTNSLTRA